MDAYYKFDGWCVILRKDDGVQQAMSRRRKPIDYPFPDIPDKTLITAELIVPDRDREAVPTAIAEGRGAELVITGVAMFDGERGVSFSEVADELGIRDQVFVGHGSFDQVKSLPIPKGCDGYVMRPNDETWPGSWYKIKPSHSVDLRVVNWETGKNGGLAGSLVVRSDDGKICAKIAGMSKEQKASVWDNPQAWLGRIVSVDYEKAHVSKGVYTLRHPRLSAIRDDKATTTTASELACIEQLRGD